MFRSPRGGAWIQQPETGGGKGARGGDPALLGPGYFREIAAILQAGGPPNVEKIKAVMAADGLVAVMPKVA